MSTLISKTLNLPTTHGTFSFLADDAHISEKPYTIAGPMPPEHEELRTNIRIKPQNVSVRDLRGYEELLDIEKNGFEIVKKSTSSICQIWEKIMLRIICLKPLIGFEKGYVQIIVSAMPISQHYEKVPGTSTGARDVPDEPAPLPHVDHTKQGGPRRISRHLTEEERQKYSTGDWRLQIVTAWRPINGIVEDYPLAVCNAYSVKESDDLVAADRCTPHHVGEIYYMRYNENQDWYWISSQTTEEMTVFISYDSHQDIGPAFIPHGTFHIPSALGTALPRESLEVRMIVISRVRGTDQ